MYVNYATHCTPDHPWKEGSPPLPTDPYRLRSSFQVSTNGFVATAQPPAESEYLGSMPAKFGMLAALQGDLDTSDGVGKVFFRQDRSPAVLRQAADLINGAFPDDKEEDGAVNPTHVVVVTWVDVANHEPPSRGDGVGKKVRRTGQGPAMGREGWCC